MWVLILLVMGRRGITISTAEFYQKGRCEEAKLQVEQIIKPTGYELKAICIHQ